MKSTRCDPAKENEINLIKANPSEVHLIEMISLVQGDVILKLQTVQKI